MAQEVILFQEMKGLGSVGEKVRVADGYARNYLIPKNIAGRVTNENLQWLEKRKEQLRQEYEERLSAAKAKAEGIQNTSLTISVEATEEDKLYGSVSARDIAEQLEERGISVEIDAIKLPEPIRELGVYDVDVELHPEVKTSLKVWVVRKEES